MFPTDYFFPPQCSFDHFSAAEEAPRPPPPHTHREELDEDFPPYFIPSCLISKRTNWESRRYWLSWWKCHQSQTVGPDLGRCQGSEGGGPRVDLGGNWEALPTTNLLSQSASFAEAGALHPGGILVGKPAPPYQEGWPGHGRRTKWLEPLIQGHNSVKDNLYGAPGELSTGLLTFPFIHLL